MRGRRTTAQVSRSVGYVFQNPDDQLFASDVRSEIEFLPKYLRWPDAKREERCARAIELTGTQTVAGFTYDVRSAHLFREGAEVVVDAYAPPADFPRVDRTVFEPALRSLKLSSP